MNPHLAIRWAQPHEGPTIQSLLAGNQLLMATAVDWTTPLGPFWLLAEAPQVIGCLMVNPGTPIGRLDMLSVRQDLPHKLKAIVVRDLCYAGFEVLHQQGSQVVMTNCAVSNPRWKRVMERRGCVFTETCEAGIKRL